MRLSTAPDRDDEAIVEVLLAALRAGVTLLDTADVYALDDTDVGHNERMVARALDAWEGSRDRVVVATKGGMSRPGGKWVPNGRARHLAVACAASAERLGRIDLYQLHVPDPRTKLSTSVRALRKALDAGIVARVGLCNVNLAQLLEAQEHCPISAVQIALSPMDDEAIYSGLVSHCHEHGIAVLTHSPFGGPRKYKRLARDKALHQRLDDVAQWAGQQHAACAAADHAAPGGAPETAYEAVLSWQYSLGVVPLPGATRTETARSAARVAVYGAVAKHHPLDQLWPAARVLRRPLLDRAPIAGADGEVVLLMGIPGAGKSTAAVPYEQRGYARLNRDDAGGRLKDLLAPLEARLAAGERHFVLDNTYATRASRARVREVAWAHGVPVRCIFVDTPIPEAQRNAAGRILDTYGKLPQPADLKAWSKTDPHAFGPNVQFRFERTLEPPDAAEGFVAVEQQPFVRRGRDGVAGTFIQEDELPHVTASQLDAWSSAGPVAVFGWEPGAKAEETIQLHGHQLPVVRCTHPAGPPICWCRSPLPGILELHTRRLGLNPELCTLISAKPTDRTLGARMGVARVVSAAGV
jgi:aryl-alcohol dehydrogenase-like predicted oxidoreductase/predicted kinase